MQLTTLKLNEFIDILASNEPAPGGGSASALAGAVGISLAAMVAGLTVGREKYKDFEDVAKEVIEKAESLKSEIFVGIDKDTDAYNAVTDVFKMPKSTDEEKAHRKEAMQAALKNATLTPFHMMVLCYSALECAKKLIGASNPNAASDLGVAAINLKSAVQGSWLNVLINLDGINDVEFKEEYRKKGQELVEKAEVIADEIYQAVLKSF